MTHNAYTKILCEVRWIGDVVLKKVPFVYDRNGIPFEPLNRWVRETFPHWKKSGQGIDQKVSRVVRFLNLLAANDRKWDEPTQNYLVLYEQSLEKQERTLDTLNAYTSTIFAFYWRCEEKGFCKKVIGINDASEDDFTFPLHVFPSNNPRRDYENPLARRGKNRRIRPSVTRNAEWEAAYENALDQGTAVGFRDAALINFILQTGARRVEAACLKTSDFERKVGPSETEVIINVDTKIYDSRDLVVPVETYLETQSFIRDDRPELISNPRKDLGFVFCSDRRNGAVLTDTSISRRLRDTYNVSPHDGRSTFATNRMVEHYRNGDSLETAIMLVKERMGHSANDDTARVLRQHYLQAKALVQAEEAGTKLENARKEIAQLKSAMAQRDRQLEGLKRELEELKKTG